MSSLQLFSVKAQTPITAENLERLNRFQDTLKVLSDSTLDSRDEVVRQNSCYAFIKTLVRSLKTEGSFNFSFDSLQRISILNAGDRSFRIFSWLLPYDDTTYRFYGAIQMNSTGKLQLFPFFDYSPYMNKPSDTITNNQKWFGALYYRMAEVKNSANKTYYMLFGWNGNNSRSNKKVVEVLTFNGKKEPVFGAPVFDFGKYDERNKMRRFIIEYKETAQVGLNYDDELQIIAYDHLQPETPDKKDDPSSYVPDGSYEGFKWENGKWRHVDNVFTSTQKEPPFPDPVDFGKKKNLYTPKHN